MSTAIHLGDNVEIDREAVEQRAESIIDILKVGAKCNTDAKTLRHALDKLEGAGRVKGPNGVTVQNCSIQMSTPSEDDEDDPRTDIENYGEDLAA